jgi:hypothetical protein
MPEEEFKARLVLGHKKSGAFPEEPEPFNYLQLGNKFLLRSQLDCSHPNAGVFDLKTRATWSVRMNPGSYFDCLRTLVIVTAMGILSRYIDHIH